MGRPLFLSMNVGAVSPPFVRLQLLDEVLQGRGLRSQVRQRVKTLGGVQHALGLSGLGLLPCFLGLGLGNLGGAGSFLGACRLGLDLGDVRAQGASHGGQCRRKQYPGGILRASIGEYVHSSPLFSISRS